MVHIIRVECPISGCDKVLNNTGSLGNHLKYRHGIDDDGFRSWIVGEVKRRKREDLDGLKASISDLHLMYTRSIEEDKESSGEDSYSYVPGELGDQSGEAGDREAYINIPREVIHPKVLALVDSIDYESIIGGGEGELSGLEVYRRTLPITTRPVNLTLAPHVFIYYAWVQQHGYEKSLSEFINECVLRFFMDRGIGIGVVRVVKDDGGVEEGEEE